MFIVEKKFTNAAPAILSLLKDQGPLTIAVVPGDGCTLDVELSLDNGRTYTDWAPGSSTTSPANATTAVGQTPTHVKVTQTVGTADSWVVITK